MHVGDGRRAEALLARDGRVAALGEGDALRREAPDAERVDLRGGLMTAGWMDAHLHFVWWAMEMTRIDLREATTLDAALATIRDRARSLPPDAWVLGGRFDKNLWGRWPTREELDRVTGGRPAVLKSKDGHSRWANTEAVRRAGLTRESVPPPGGIIEVDERGELTGITKEGANELLDRAVPPPTHQEMLDAARRGQAEAWRRGVTGFENLDSFLGVTPFAAFEVMRDRGELGLRISSGMPYAHLDDALGLGLRTGFGDEWLRVGHLKIFTDGALGSQTAALEAPYEGTHDRGVLVCDPERLARDVARAADGGIAVAIHAIGDRAVRVALDAIAPTRTSHPGLRPKIEHLQLLRRQDLGRFASERVIASMQPIHATSDRDIADRHWGAERCTRAYPWRTLLASGARLAFGSDAPVEPIDPLLGIHAAVARKRPADREPWHPEQALSLDEAIAGYTTGTAHAIGRESDLGTLAVGMRCDATIVDRDLATLDGDALLAAKVIGTVTDGVIRCAEGLT